jgi:hypothetical protein
MNERHEKPRRKREKILTERVGAELVVVDTKRNKAHCLNESSAFIWEQCDGETTVVEIAERVEERFGHSEGLEVTRLALHQFVAARLLDGQTRVEAGMNRRAFISKAALAAAAIPVIASVIAPTPVYAASCGLKNAICGPGWPPCCPGFVCNPNSGKCRKG